MDKGSKILGFLLLFNSISAIAGGISLILGVNSQPSWTEHTDFNSLYFPGVILMAIVGGSALIAFIAFMKNVTGWQLACIVSAVIMIFWLIGEVVSIRTFHFLQIVYLATSLGIIWYTPKGKTK